MRNTKTEVIGNKYYCVYCGKIAKHDTDIEDYYIYHYHFCDCKGALLDIQKQEIDEKLKAIANDTNKILNNYRYEYELQELKIKYNKL